MDDDDDGIRRVGARRMGWTGNVGGVRIVSDEGKEWIAREALGECWLEDSRCTLANGPGRSDVPATKFL